MDGFYETRLSGIEFIEGYNLNFRAHFHEQIEFLYIYEGRIEIFVDDYSATMEQGDLLFVFPNQVHSFKFVENEHHCILFSDAKICNKYDKYLFTYRPKTPLIRADNLTEELRFCIKYLSSAHQVKTQFEKEMQQSYFQILIGRILEQITLTQIPNSDKQNLTQKVITYCLQNFKNVITLESMAIDLGISKYYLSKIFSGKLHTNYSEFINRQRLEVAIEMLMNSNTLITQIAFDCGFDNVRTFNRVFENKIKMSPREYRKQNILKL